MTTIDDTGLLSVMTAPVLIKGREAGLAVSLGKRFLFYTSRADLIELDGCLFDSMQQIKARVASQDLPARAPAG